MATYKQLKVWQTAISISSDVYELTKDKQVRLKHENEFNLINEIRICAKNISSSIAIGAQKRTNETFLSYLRIANSASIELDTKLRIARDLDEFTFNSIRDILDKIEEFQKMIVLLRRPLEQ